MRPGASCLDNITVTLVTLSVAHAKQSKPLQLSLLYEFYYTRLVEMQRLLRLLLFCFNVKVTFRKVEGMTFDYTHKCTFVALWSSISHSMYTIMDFSWRFDGKHGMALACKEYGWP